jgi:hypothetical protein
VCVRSVHLVDVDDDWYFRVCLLDSINHLLMYDVTTSCWHYQSSVKHTSVISLCYYAAAVSTHTIVHQTCTVQLQLPLQSLCSVTLSHCSTVYDVHMLVAVSVYVSMRKALPASGMVQQMYHSLEVTGDPPMSQILV